MTTNATLAQKAARHKLSLLELAAELDNVSKACKIMGYSREQFHEISRNFQSFGAEGLVDKIRGAKSPHPNMAGSIAARWTVIPLNCSCSFKVLNTGQLKSEDPRAMVLLSV